MTRDPPGGALAGRIALITGASRGLGAALAERFAAEGAQLILLARTVGALEALDDRIRAVVAGAEPMLVPVDLAETGRLDALGPALFERFSRLDILLANAGILGGLTPLAHYDEQTWRRVFDINVHANWHLIRTLEPLLKRSDAGRAIFVTADVARTAKPFWGAYAAAKAALEAMARTWAAELQSTSVKVEVIDPGPLATRLRAEAYPGEDAASVPAPQSVTGRFVDLARA